MVNTRRSLNDPPTATQVSSQIVNPANESSATIPLQEVIAPEATLPVPELQNQGEIPQAPSPLPLAITPFGGASLPLGAHISTNVIPASAYPTYGLPNIPPRPDVVGVSGHALHPLGQHVPPYIQGLEPQRVDRQEFSGPYTEESDDSSLEDDIAPRRRRHGKKPVRREKQPLTIEERIKAHEAKIQKLKIDMERRQVGHHNQPAAPIPVINLDDYPRPRPVVSQRTDPSDLLPLRVGNPDDPTPPFTEEIMQAHISRKFKMPNIKTYDGMGDPANHVRTFSNALLLQPVNDAIKCRGFPQTLGGMAQLWYCRLPPNSIGSFKELIQAFINQFVSGRVHEKSSASLMNL